MTQNSYDGSPTLYLLSTPIGNLDDITLRTINILKEVEVIFCEDTRVTSLLLQHLNIKKKLISNFEFNENKNCEKLLEHLQSGKNVGLVSDRGTPIISDPGYGLAKVAIENGFNVVSIPGATALIPALTSSGISPMPFLYYGFLNSKDSKRRKELENLKIFEYTMIFYEAPHRIEKTLNDVFNILGNRKISISREITKKYEEVYRGNVQDIIPLMGDIKGEMVLIVEGNKEPEDFSNLSIDEHIKMYIKMGLEKKEAIKKVAHDRKVNKNEIYNIYNRKEDTK